MVTIFLERQPGPEEMEEIREMAAVINDLVIYTGKPYPGGLEALCRPLPEPSPEEKKRINYDIFHRVLDFGERRFGGVAVADLLMCSRAGVWHYHKFRTYFRMRNLCYILAVFEETVRSSDSVVCFISDALLNEALKRHPGVDIRFRPVPRPRPNRLTLLKWGLFFIARSLWSWLNSNTQQKVKYLVIDHSLRQTCLDLDTLKPGQDNYNLAYLFDRLDQEFAILSNVEIPRIHSDIPFRWERHYLRRSRKGIPVLFNEPVLLRAFISVNIRRELRGLVSGLVNALDLMAAEETDLTERLIIMHLRSLTGSSRYFLFKYLAFRKFFAGSGILSVGTIDENSPAIKAILDAAAAQGIRRVGIQHGTIHDLHPAYVFTPQDIRRGVIPDLTLAWGTRWKDFLVNVGNYPPSAVEITGQIRSDIIPRLLESGKDILPEALRMKGRIVVFASQPQRDPALRRQAAFDVFTAAAALPEIHLVLKPHPAERDDEPYYREIAREAGCTRWTFLPDIDLYLLISQCDVLITCFSTVGGETVYFRKPLITLDHLRQDIQGYHREGVALQATGSMDLTQLLREILSGQGLIDRKAYEGYIERNAFSVDGMVSVRIILWIRNQDQNPSGSRQ